MKAWCCLVFERGQVPLGISFSQEISELTYVCGLCGPKRRLPVRVLLPFSLNPSSFSGPKGLEPPGYKPSLGSEADQTVCSKKAWGGRRGQWGAGDHIQFCTLSAFWQRPTACTQLLSVMSVLLGMSACSCFQSCQTCLS